MQVLSNVDIFCENTIEILYQIFKDHFIDNETFLRKDNKSYKIDIKQNILCECPFNNEKKPERFWHIITKENKQNKKRNNPCPYPENNRIYDNARAKRIHWIKPIIEDWLNSNDIVYFYEKKKGKITLNIWHFKLDFLVILRKESNSSNRFLVTTFLIYKNQKHRFMNKLKEYNNKKPLGIEWF